MELFRSLASGLSSLGLYRSPASSLSSLGLYRSPASGLSSLGSRGFGFLALVILALASSASPAQEKSSPKVGELIRAGLGLPEGQARPGNGRRVKVRGSNDELVTALVHCEIGGSYIVMMPDGKMASVESRYTTPTREAFAPANRSGVKDGLRKTLGDEFRFADGKNHVYAFNCSSDFQKRASEILEAVHDGVYNHFKEMGFTVVEPRVPLVVIIFKTQQEFEKFGEVSENINGYYSVLSNYIVFYEESSLNIIGTTLASDEVLSTVAHEGVHQTLANIGVQPRLSIWPAWITEGLAEFYSPTTDETPVRWKGKGEVNDLRMASLEPYLKGVPNTRGNVVKAIVLSPRLDAAGYAASWGLVHYLNEVRPASLLEYVRSLSLREPLADPVPSSGRGTRQEAELELFFHFFGNDPADLEAGMFKHLKKLPFKHPLANATHYVAILEYRNGNNVRRMASMSVVEDAAIRWRDTAWGKLTADQQSTGKSYVKTLPNRAEAQKYANRWMRF